MSEPLISADEIHEIMRDSLYRDEEAPDQKIPPDAVLAEGITRRFAFHPGRLESHRERVREFLLALPDSFQASGGGGMSFLNACMDRNGVQWGEHRDIEQLFCLGTALKLCSLCLPRDMWDALPGGMPYYVVKASRE